MVREAKCFISTPDDMHCLDSQPACTLMDDLTLRRGLRICKSGTCRPKILSRAERTLRLVMAPMSVAVVAASSYSLRSGGDPRIAGESRVSVARAKGGRLPASWCKAALKGKVRARWRVQFVNLCCQAEGPPHHQLQIRLHEAHPDHITYKQVTSIFLPLTEADEATSQYSRSLHLPPPQDPTHPPPTC